MNPRHFVPFLTGKTPSFSGGLLSLRPSPDGAQRALYKNLNYENALQGDREFTR